MLTCLVISICSLQISVFGLQIRKHLSMKKMHCNTLRNYAFSETKQLNSVTHWWIRFSSGWFCIIVPVYYISFNASRIHEINERIVRSCFSEKKQYCPCCYCCWVNQSGANCSGQHSMPLAERDAGSSKLHWLEREN